MQVEVLAHPPKAAHQDCHTHEPESISTSMIFLVVKQVSLGIDAALGGEPTYPASAHDTVAGNKDRQGIASVGLTNRAGATTHHVRHIAVGARLAERNVKQRLPYLETISCSRRCKRKREPGQVTIEIGVQLPTRLAKQLRLLLDATPSPVQCDDALFLLRHCQRTKRTMEGELRQIRLQAAHHGTAARALSQEPSFNLLAKPAAISWQSQRQQT